LGRSEDDEYVEYGVEQAERVERRGRSSTYAVINTGSSSGIGSVDIRELNGDDVGEFAVILAPPPPHHHPAAVC